jgi:hypothetical protein
MRVSPKVPQIHGAVELKVSAVLESASRRYEHRYDEGGRMDKPGQVSLTFDRPVAGFWSGFVNAVEGGLLRAETYPAWAVIPVQGYDLSDHQFVRLKVDMKTAKGEVLKGMIVHVPRQLIVLITDNKYPPSETFYFAAGAATPKS